MRPKILFVDDDPNVERMVKLFLIGQNYEIIYAKNGRAAFRLFEQHKDINLILTDVQMPEMDGIALTEEIRKIDKNIPIVIVSSFGQENLAQDCINMGATKVMPKPFESTALIQTIESFISK